MPVSYALSKVLNALPELPNAPPANTQRTAQRDLESEQAAHSYSYSFRDYHPQTPQSPAPDSSARLPTF